VINVAALERCHRNGIGRRAGSSAPPFVTRGKSSRWRSRVGSPPLLPMLGDWNRCWSSAATSMPITIYASFARARCRDGR
jgi:hypothetical protein